MGQAGGHKVLVVDDDAETRSLISEVLRGNGFEVSEAIDGLDGLEKVNQVMPDVLLSGIIMPRMDGFTLVETIKKNTITANIPTIFLSHMGREEDRVRAEAIGVDEFFVTTMTPPAEIVNWINSLVSHSEYLLIPNPYELDAQKLAQDFGLNRDFLCSEGGEKLAIRLKPKNPRAREFEAEIICV